MNPAESVSIRALDRADWDGVREIYEQGIATGNATFQTIAPSWEEWDSAHTTDCRLVATAGDSVIGWSALSPVSRRHVYRGVAEVSVYVHERARGRGVGRQLLASLIAASEVAEYWTLQASVFPENHATLRLHKALGFREVGRRERIGMHHGVWRDTILLERRTAVARTSD